MIEMVKLPEHGARSPDGLICRCRVPVEARRWTNMRTGVYSWAVQPNKVRVQL